MTQIPKKLHYVWIGDSEKPEIFNKCLKSWQEKMPDYEIIEINKENFGHILRIMSEFIIYMKMEEFILIRIWK